jgi:hypothetical protein
LRKLNLGHLDYLKSMGPSQGSISASPEITSIAPDFVRGAGLRGSPASNASYSSAQRYCFSIFAHYCRYYETFPLRGRCSCARSYYRVATIFMCANRSAGSRVLADGAGEGRMFACVAKSLMRRMKASQLSKLLMTSMTPAAT